MIEIKKASILIFFVILLNCLSPGMDEDFKLIRIIGDDRDDYLFSKISGAALSSCKEIFISDFNGHFIAKYDWEGNFIKRVGTPGAGPGDFKSPQQISVIDESLFILDFQNSRIAEMDLNLENIQYFKTSGKVAYMKSFMALEKNKFLINPLLIGQSGTDSKDKFKLFLVDRNSKIKHAFFEYTPVPPEVLGQKDEKKIARLDMLSSPVFGLDDKKEKMLVSFVTPDNPIVFYLYTINGEMVKKFHFKLDRKYHFLTEIYSRKRLALSMLNGLHAVNLRSIFFYNHCWYIFIEKKYYKKHDDVVREYLYVKYNETGKFIGKFDIPIGFECFHVSKDGYLLGKQPYAEIEQLMIYKFE